METSGSFAFFVAQCQGCTRVSVLWQAALTYLHAQGIKMVSYHSNDAQRPGSDHLGIVADGFPQDWVCHYIGDNLSKVDPIPQLAARVGRPFLWSRAADLEALTPAQLAYLQELSSSGLGDGLAMCAYGPGMRNAYVGLGFGGPAPDLSDTQIFELQCAVQICHLKYCELTEWRQASFDPLTKREREVLEWIAQGKSNSVIAEILGISRHTVDTLLRRLYEKLGVNDRTTAAIRGVGSGLVVV
ncbi:LuxR family transcriptional regulator [Sulfitobacter albidus]|uniref:LuxR family transcriptional regulator n=1 Tax=Sulfitobacter albidus TaxID=2829501 RepID=A0A975JC00_9RHOB|nr:LuxR family transcriptional regulator [Sulfitobacter albidus]QUJ75460.1 LuxR family transcriptional regulator [Sulfitobacter albidus]